METNRNKTHKGVLVGLILGSVFLVFLFLEFAYPFGPDGNYREEFLSWDEGDAYYEFKNGNITLVAVREDGSEYRTPGPKYAKENGHWVLILPDGERQPLTFTLFSIRQGNLTGTRTQPRMFFKPQPNKRKKRSEKE